MWVNCRFSGGDLKSDLHKHWLNLDLTLLFHDYLKYEQFESTQENST